MGNLLHYETLPEWTVVNGRIAYDKAKDTLLRHVRARDVQGKNLDVPLLWPRTEAPARGHEGRVALARAARLELALRGLPRPLKRSARVTRAEVIS